MKRPSIFDLEKEKFECDFSINGEIQWILSTEFSSMDYNKIFNDFPDKEFPILLEDGKPIIHNNEPLRDNTDEEILKYNESMAKYRLASLIKLIVKNSDVLEMSLDKIIDILDNTKYELYEQLVEKINYIIGLRFNQLQTEKRKLARHVLAFTDGEKSERDKILKEASRKRQDLYNKIDDITLLVKECKSDKQIKEYYTQINECEKEIAEFEEILNINNKDRVKIENGISSDFVLLDLSEKYSWMSLDLIFRAMTNNLTSQEEAVIELAKAKSELSSEHHERAFPNNKSKEGK